MSSRPKKMSLRTVMKSSGNDKDIQLFLSEYTECTGFKFMVAEEFVCQKCNETRSFDVARCSGLQAELWCILCALPQTNLNAMALVASIAQQRVDIRIPASKVEKLPWLDSLPTPEFKIALLRICGVNARSSSADWSAPSGGKAIRKANSESLILHARPVPSLHLSVRPAFSTIPDARPAASRKPDAQPVFSTLACLRTNPSSNSSTCQSALLERQTSTPTLSELLSSALPSTECPSSEHAETDSANNATSSAHERLKASKPRRTKVALMTHSQQLRATIWNEFVESLEKGPAEVRRAAEALRDSKAKARFLLARICELKELAHCRNAHIWKVLADVFPHVFQDSADLVEALHRDDIECIQRFMRDSQHVPTFLYIESRLRLHWACKDFNGIFRSFRLAEDWVCLPWIRKEVIRTAKFALAYTEQPNMRWRTHQTFTVLLELAPKVPELKPYLKRRVIALVQGAQSSDNYAEELSKAISFAEVVCPEEEMMILQAKAQYFDRVFKPRWSPTLNASNAGASRGVTFGEHTVVTLRNDSDVPVSATVSSTSHSAVTIERSWTSEIEPRRPQQKNRRARSVPLRRSASVSFRRMGHHAADESVAYPIMTLSASSTNVPFLSVPPCLRDQVHTLISSSCSSISDDCKTASWDKDTDLSERSSESSAASDVVALPDTHPDRNRSSASTVDTLNNSGPVIPQIGSIDGGAVTIPQEAPTNEELVLSKNLTISEEKRLLKSGLSSSTTLCPKSCDDECSSNNFNALSWSPKAEKAA